MQNKTDKGTSLVSKSLPVVNSNSVYRLLSARKKKYYDSLCEKAGLRYYMPKLGDTFVGFAIKSHSIKAEYLEFSVGIRL